MAEGLVDGYAARNRQLEKIAALADWAAFERLWGDLYALLGETPSLPRPASGAAAGG